MILCEQPTASHPEVVKYLSEALRFCPGQKANRCPSESDLKDFSLHEPFRKLSPYLFINLPDVNLKVTGP